MAATGEAGTKREGTMDATTEARRKIETAKFMLRVIKAEQAHGIRRPDAETFRARMQTQAREEKIMTTMRLIPDDVDCPSCGERAVLRTCHECGQSAMITDCGHESQPRPIAAGREDGSDLAHAYCAFCAAR